MASPPATSSAGTGKGADDASLVESRPQQLYESIIRDGADRILSAALLKLEAADSGDPNWVAPLQDAAQYLHPCLPKVAKVQSMIQQLMSLSAKLRESRERCKVALKAKEDSVEQAKQEVLKHESALDSKRLESLKADEVSKEQEAIVSDLSAQLKAAQDALASAAAKREELAKEGRRLENSLVHWRGALGEAQKELCAGDSGILGEASQLEQEKAAVLEGLKALKFNAD